ncbi:MAG: GNAT family N-acetyltransferase [Bdellovibrionales bacterium]|nr:GNAT family N-acetyltransferase [Bdellovibrionales bacterium]
MRLDLIQKPEELKELEALLNQCFPVPPGKSFFHDFPVWDPKNAANCHRFGAFDGDRLLASLLVRKADVKLGAGMHPIGLIGAVATHDENRGKGLASALVEAAVDWGETQNLGGLVLWGSEHSLYGRFGFNLMGHQRRVPLSAALARATGSNLGALEIKNGFVPEIFRLRQVQPDGLRLIESDLQWFSKHQNVVWRSAWRGSVCTAYAGYGRGIDLPHMVHEWGGDPADARSLFNVIHQMDPSAELLAPKDFAKRLGLETGERGIAESLALIRPIRLSPDVLDSIWLWGLDAA